MRQALRVTAVVIGVTMSSLGAMACSSSSDSPPATTSSSVQTQTSDTPSTVHDQDTTRDTLQDGSGDSTPDTLRDRDSTQTSAP